MLNQKERLQNYTANANQIELEAVNALEREAVQLLKKGCCDKFVRNKCFISLKRIQELKERFI